MCLILKCPSSTIWASGADSTRAFHEDDGKIRGALEIIAADNERRQDTQHEAAALCVKLQTALLHYCILCCWDSSWLAVPCRTRKWTFQLLCGCLSYCSPVRHHCEKSYQSLRHLPRLSLEHRRLISIADLLAWDAAQDEKRKNTVDNEDFGGVRNSRSTTLTLTACFQARANSWMLPKTLAADLVC